MNLKPFIAIFVIILLFPVVAMLWPKPMTMEDVRKAFEDHGLTVENYQEMVPPQLEAAEHVTMRVEGARVNVYRYDESAKIAKNYEYQKTDVGTAIVQSSGLAQQLGAAQPTIFTAPARNGKFMMTATSENKVLNNRLLNIFKEL